MALLSAQRKQVTLAPVLGIKNHAFDKFRFKLRQGQVTILSSAPSVGKSVFARNLAAKSQDISTLFFSADSDEYTVRTSITGALTGEKMTEIEKHLLNDEDGAWSTYYNNYLHSADQVEWNFSPNINLEFIELKLKAYAEIYGDYPQLVVIDNLGDMVTEDGDEYGELRVIARDLRKIARYTNAHILALHHVKGAFEDGMKPITLAALLGNLGKVPENVLGLNWSDASQQRVQMTVPKARGTRRGLTIPIDLDYETGSVNDFYYPEGGR